MLYHWQKFTDGQWVNVSATSDFTSATMSIRNAGLSTVGEYRCMVNVIYYDTTRGDEYYITATSESVCVQYVKRTSLVMNPITANNPDDISKPTLSVSVKNAHSNSVATPTGKVTFISKALTMLKVMMLS